MKSLNTLKFISNAIEELTKYNEAIAVAETYEDSKNVARKMIGYDVGINIYSFWRREDAERSIKDDVQTELVNLREAGRERIEVQETLDGATIYVPDTDIYYEWAIVENNIQ